MCFFQIQARRCLLYHWGRMPAGAISTAAPCSDVGASQVELVIAQPQRGQEEQLPPHVVPQEEHVLQDVQLLPVVEVVLARPVIGVAERVEQAQFD